MGKEADSRLSQSLFLTYDVGCVNSRIKLGMVLAHDKKVTFTPPYL